MSFCCHGLDSLQKNPPLSTDYEDVPVYLYFYNHDFCSYCTSIRTIKVLTSYVLPTVPLPPSACNHPSICNSSIYYVLYLLTIRQTFSGEISISVY